MNTHFIKVLIFLLFGIFFIFPKSANAVIPPDFIFNIGNQVAQFFSIILLFLTTIFGTLFHFFKTRYYTLKHKKLFLILIIFAIIIISIICSYFYSIYKQKLEYKKWVEESKNYTTQIKNPLLLKKLTTKITENITNQIEQLKIDSKNNTNKLSKKYSFFEKNQNTPLFITNEDFKKITTEQTTNYIVLDAREDIEYEIGHFPKSLHIRFADLKAEDFVKLPKDKFIYVICWSGIRGKEVTEFLRTKKIIASYLENGANGWVEFGGTWTGSIKFSEIYTDIQYQRVFNTNDVKNKIKDGTILIDTREPYKFKQWHITNSLNIPILHTPTIQLETKFNQIPKNSKIITVCDDYVNCFDAKVTGVELEKKGHQFLGRYNKPWEYER